MQFSSEVQTTITPHTQQPLVSRTYPSKQAVDGAITKSKAAQKEWAKVSLKERIEIGRRFIVSRLCERAISVVRRLTEMRRKSSERPQMRSH